MATIAVNWTNYGSAAATERWVPGHRLVDFSGAVIRTLPSDVVLKTLVHDQSADGSGQQPVPVSATESVRVDLAGLTPGHYTLRASVDWQQHKPGASHVVDSPPLQLARDGRDDSGYYPIAALDIPRTALTSGPTRAYASRQRHGHHDGTTPVTGSSAACVGPVVACLS